MLQSLLAGNKTFLSASGSHVHLDGSSVMHLCVCIFKCLFQHEDYFNELSWEKQFSVVFLWLRRAHFFRVRLLKWLPLYTTLVGWFTFLMCGAISCCWIDVICLVSYVMDSLVTLTPQMLKTADLSKSRDKNIMVHSPVKSYLPTESGKLK